MNFINNASAIKLLQPLVISLIAPFQIDKLGFSVMILLLDVNY